MYQAFESTAFIFLVTLIFQQSSRSEIHGLRFIPPAVESSVISSTESDYEITKVLHDLLD